MPRIKLQEQPEYQFRYTIRVQPRDVNLAGHVGNETIIALVGTARAELIRSMGFSEVDLGDGETGIIMSDLVVNYKAEASIFDELLIETCLGELGRKSFRAFHRLTRGKDVVALVETGFVIFNYRLRKVVSVPQTFRQALLNPPPRIDIDPINDKSKMTEAVRS